MVAEQSNTIRCDKWLWYARFFKTRTLCASLISKGELRVNGQKISKASTSIGPGDVLTFMQGDRVRVVELLAIGTRRGPATEAQALYNDMSPQPVLKEKILQNPKYEGKGRPSGKDRRAIASFSKNGLE